MQELGGDQNRFSVLRLHALLLVRKRDLARKKQPPYPALPVNVAVCLPLPPVSVAGSGEYFF